MTSEFGQYIRTALSIIHIWGYTCYVI